MKGISNSTCGSASKMRSQTPLAKRETARRRRAFWGHFPPERSGRILGLPAPKRHSWRPRLLATDEQPALRGSGKEELRNHLGLLRYHEGHADTAFAVPGRVDASLPGCRPTAAACESATRHKAGRRSTQGSSSCDCRPASASAIVAQRHARRGGAKFRRGQRLGIAGGRRYRSRSSVRIARSVRRRAICDLKCCGATLVRARAFAGVAANPHALINRQITETLLLQPLDLRSRAQFNIRAVAGRRIERDHGT
jgi:hypothetical protein